MLTCLQSDCVEGRNYEDNEVKESLHSIQEGLKDRIDGGSELLGESCR